jgi:rhodanese-related sulfurtransferase
MIWTLVTCLCVLIAAAIVWHVYEGRWDRRLFHAEPGSVIVNLRAREAMKFLTAHADTQVLDVRSEAEFKGGALPGAVHVSIQGAGFEEKVGSLEKGRPVLVYCAGGYRSRKAAGVLKVQGFRNIQHLHRGYHSWRLAGLPVNPGRG